MARGKKVSPAERRTWLRQFEQGTSFSEIARKAHRAASAVRSHVDVARQEREQGNARAQLTRQAYADHHRDLLGFAEEIRTKTGTWMERAVPLPADIRSRLLLQGLRKHVPNSPLWAAWDAIVSTREELVQVESEFKNKLEHLASETYPEINVDGIAAGMITRFRLSPRLDAETDSWYRIEQIGKGFDLSWGAHMLASAVTDEPRIQEIRRWYTSLIEYRDSDLLAFLRRYRDLIVGGDTLARDLEGEVEILLLRRILPGHCSICPDAAPGRSTRARATQTQS